MGFADILKKFEKVTTDNSPNILTAIGVTGTAVTAYLAGRASFKAAEVLAETEYYEDTEEKDILALSLRDKVELTWKLYIPAAGSFVMTIACIIAANRIGTRRAAAMAAAYSLSEKAFEEYKKKVVDKMGENKEQAVRDEIAQDHIDQNPVKDREVIITGIGDVLCYDAYSGRYFQSDVQSLRAAMNDVNQQVVNSYYASLTDFYDRIGLARTSISDDVGWNADKLLNLEFSTGMTEDKRPCIHVDFNVAPIRDYHRVH